MAARFWVNGTGTWTVNGTANWSASSGGAAGASAPGTADTATFDTASGGGLVTVNGDVAVQTITIGTFSNGTLDFSANNNNATLSLALSATGTHTRTFNMGNGLWTVQGFNNNTWDMTTVTNLTFNAGSSTLSFIPSTTPIGSIAFVGGGRSFNIVTHSGVTNQQALVISGSPTIATLTIMAPANVSFSVGTTTTISNAPSWVGTSANQFFIGSGSTTGVAKVVLSSPGGTAQWAAIRGLTITTNALTATNSFDLKGNTLVTITPPSAGGGARIVTG